MALGRVTGGEEEENSPPRPAMVSNGLNAHWPILGYVQYMHVTPGGDGRLTTAYGRTRVSDKHTPETSWTCPMSVLTVYDCGITSVSFVHFIHGGLVPCLVTTTSAKVRFLRWQPILLTRCPSVLKSDGQSLSL